jgi:hypothetical protein
VVRFFAVAVFVDVVVGGAMDVGTVAVMRVHHLVGSPSSAIDFYPWSVGIVPSSCRRR